MRTIVTVALTSMLALGGVRTLHAGVEPACCQGFLFCPAERNGCAPGPVCADLPAGTTSCSIGSQGTVVPGSTCNPQTGLCNVGAGCCSCTETMNVFCTTDLVACAQCGSDLFLPGGVCGDGVGGGGGFSMCLAPEPETCDTPPTICADLDLSNAIFCAPNVPCLGTNGNDVICGTGGDNRILAKGGDDIVCAGPGNDRVNGGGGNDRIDTEGSCGLSPNGLIVIDDDRANGDSGDDVLRGGSGNDRLRGNQGNDRIYGEGGSDDMRGSGGQDLLVGGTGTDTASGGGTGEDTCEAETEVGCELDCVTD
jgi:hypothetical protein